MKITLTLAASENQKVALAAYTPAQKKKLDGLNESLAKIRDKLARFKKQLTDARKRWEKIRLRRRLNPTATKLKAAEKEVRDWIAQIREATTPLRKSRAKLLAAKKALRVSAGFKASLKKRRKKPNSKSKAKRAKFKLK